MSRQPDPMRDSLYATVHGVEYKSCPCCSRDAGRAVFHRLSEFGDRQLAPGKFAIQAWCNDCRKKHSGASYAALKGA